MTAPSIWFIGVFLYQLKLIAPTPIQFPINNAKLANPYIPKDFCILPPDYGTQGLNKFLEECDSLDQYEYLPIPAQAYQQEGIHPKVCCPRKIYKDNFICFPTDAWCPIYKKIEYSTEEPVVPVPTLPPAPTMADQKCFDTPLPGTEFVLKNCVTINRCSKLLEYANAPATVFQACGFDEEESSLMICCPEELTTEPVGPELPRFPVGNEPGGEARQCHDKHDMCTTWKNNKGCALDQEFIISDLDGNGKVASASMFGFMQTACPESCGWCGSKGCVDEHPNCPAWARSGLCVLTAFHMAHMCRESCGVCGFLSPDNQEEQVKDGKSYTDFTKDNFDCGRFRLLSDINGDDFEAETVKPVEVKQTEPLQEDDLSVDDFDLRSEDDDVFFSTDGNTTDFFCGATMVSDRWVVAASHCYDDFGNAATTGPIQVRINTIRDNTPYKELVEIKRVFKHPLYKYPNLYNDVAVLELGRRVEYDYDLYGDTPSCLDRGIEVEGKLATIQGYGTTEDGTRGKLLEANVTIISNEQCKKQIDHNTTENSVARKQIDSALPQGLEYGLLCARGEEIIRNGQVVYKGSCKGDSGGPLTTKDEKDRTTLVGIVSGGIGCGKGFPGWYTRVEFYSKWIKCIIETSRTTPILKKIQEACVYVTEPFKKCQEVDPDDLIFGGDLRSVDDEAQCNDDGTYKDSKFQPVFDPIFDDEP